MHGYSKSLGQNFLKIILLYVIIFTILCVNFASIKVELGRTVSSFEGSWPAVLTVVVLCVCTCGVEVLAPAPQAAHVGVSVEPPATAPGPQWTLRNWRLCTKTLERHISSLRNFQRLFRPAHIYKRCFSKDESAFIHACLGYDIFCPGLHLIGQEQGRDRAPMGIHCAISPPHNSRAFLWLQKETLYPLTVTPHSIPCFWQLSICFLSLWIWLLWTFLWMDSYNTWFSVSDFVHLV